MPEYGPIMNGQEAAVPDGFPVVDEEQVGPLLTTTRCSDLCDTTRRANGREAWQRRIAPRAPFGNVTRPGTGDEFGEESLQEYTTAGIVNVPKAA